jgi:2-oxoglutarate dehydrogenase E2 component (dihydrolipoamide succinyltransferase)
MPTEVIMPQMGESLSEGTVTKWLKKVGDRVSRDEPLLEISTDKVDTEVPAPVTGVLEKILVQEGETVAINTAIAIIANIGGSEAEKPATTEQTLPPSKTSTDTGGHFKATEKAAVFQRKTPSPQQAPTHETESKEDVLSPAVLSLANRYQIPMSELQQIPGTGEGGRIRKKDVKRYVEQKQQRQQPPPPQAPQPPPPPNYVPPAYWPAYPPPNPFAVMSPYPYPPSPQALIPSPQSLPEAIERDETPEQYLYKPEPEDTVVPMSAMRKKIADHMVWSQKISAQVTSFSECDMHRIAQYREEHKEEFQAAEGIPLTFLPFVAEATVKAIKDFPIFNASVLPEKIVMKKHVHLGVAVALDEGLVVPVVRNADEMNFVGLARSVHDLAERARNKDLSVEEVQGATFTVTNPGMFGGLTGTPMISQPQVAILGLGAVQKKPVVIEDAIGIRPIMMLALTFDHRVIDGAIGFQFLERVRLNLEHFELP